MVPSKDSSGSARPTPEPTRMALFGKSYNKSSGDANVKVGSSSKSDGGDDDE